MAARELLLGIAVGLLGAGCGGGGSDAATTTTTTTVVDTTTSTSTTTPERPTSTTTTTYDPASVEGQVEAAYLKSWDVYADAVYNLRLDEAALAEVFGGKHLETKRREIDQRIDEGRSAMVLVDHDYSVKLVDSETAIVIDTYVNHQVLIDPESKVPLEPDPAERINDIVTLKLLTNGWRVTLKEHAGA